MRTPSLVAAALAACWHGRVAVAAGGSFLQGSSGRLSKPQQVCSHWPEELAHDEIAYAEMTTRVCMVNWVLMDRVPYKWKHVQDIGCWALKALNTNNLMSSAVYQSRIDNRCTLVFSGYHGRLMGVKKGIMDSVQLGRNKVKVCGYDVYEPFVRVMKKHMSEANWSSVAHALGGPESTCSDVSVAAESMGGSIAEILAGCANQDLLSGLQDASLPTWKIQKLFTFGSIAPSVQPIKNALREDGCFPGSRTFINGDLYARMGTLIGTKHAQMEAMELFHRDNGAAVSRRIYACDSKDATGDRKHRAPPASEAMTALIKKMDKTHHEITTYMADLRTIKNITPPSLKDMQKPPPPTMF